VFSVPTPLPDDPGALQLILRAAAAEIGKRRGAPTWYWP